MSSSPVTRSAGPLNPTARDGIDVSGLGRPLRGPQAVTGEWVRFWHLTFNIAKTQWKLRFFGSVLGYFWQLFRPLLLFGVLYVFFTKVGHVGSGKQTGPGEQNHFYGAQLLGAIVLMTFFQESTMGSVRCVIDNEALVRKMEFPRLVIPLSITLLCLFNLGLNLVVVFVFGTIEGVRPMLSWVELPILVVFMAVLSAGISMLLSTGFVYFRDLQPIWEVILQVLFYASPVIVPMLTVSSNLSRTLQHVYMLNPLAVDLQQFKHAIINHGAYGSAAYAYHGYVGIGVSVLSVVAVFALGFWVFNRAAPYVAENL